MCVRQAVRLSRFREVPDKMSGADGNRDRLTACRTQTDKLKDELQGKLTNSGIHRGTQTTEIPVAHCREVIYGSFI
jgi:hypothetical protein